MNEELVKKIYDNTLPIIMNGIEKKYIDEFIIAYHDYIIDSYGSYDTKGNNIDNLVSIFTKLELSKWQNVPFNIKYSEILKDEALDNIKRISNIGYKYALARIDKRTPDWNNEYLEPTLSIEDAESNIKLIEENLLKVRKFNESLAKTLASEGILDLEYACGKIEVMSMRIGRQIK